jgi:maleamate amidohydrolase
MNEWKKIMPDLDRKIYEQAGYGKPQNYGKKPALLIIDMIVAFTGTNRGKPWKRLRNSGQVAVK